MDVSETLCRETLAQDVFEVLLE